MTLTVNGIDYEVGGDGAGDFPYTLHGPRGASYSLMRNDPDPEIMFAINNRRFGVVKDMPWFTDRNGVLEVCR